MDLDTEKLTCINDYTKHIYSIMINLEKLSKSYFDEMNTYSRRLLHQLGSIWTLIPEPLGIYQIMIPLAGYVVQLAEYGKLPKDKLISFVKNEGLEVSLNLKAGELINTYKYEMRKNFRVIGDFIMMIMEIKIPLRRKIVALNHINELYAAYRKRQ